MGFTGWAGFGVGPSTRVGVSGLRDSRLRGNDGVGASPLAPLAFHEGGDCAPFDFPQDRPFAGRKGARTSGAMFAGDGRGGGREIPACAGMTGWPGGGATTRVGPTVGVVITRHPRTFSVTPAEAGVCAEVRDCPAQGLRDSRLRGNDGVGASPLAPLAFHEGGDYAPFDFPQDRPFAGRKGARCAAERCSRGMGGAGVGFPVGVFWIPASAGKTRWGMGATKTAQGGTARAVVGAEG